MLRRALAQLSLSSMKSANVCIGRPVLITSADGRQEVRLLIIPTSAFSGAFSMFRLYSAETKMEHALRKIVNGLMFSTL